jgi:hypothetical protein
MDGHLTKSGRPETAQTRRCVPWVLEQFWDERDVESASGAQECDCPFSAKAAAQQAHFGQQNPVANSPRLPFAASDCCGAKTARYLRLMLTGSCRLISTDFPYS